MVNESPAGNIFRQMSLRRWRHTAKICFSCIKRRWTTGLPFYLKMSCRRRIPRQQAGSGEKSATFDTCNFLVENLPAFDPNRVLLRRVFFICEDEQVCLRRVLPKPKVPTSWNSEVQKLSRSPSRTMWRWNIYPGLCKQCDGEQYSCRQCLQTTTGTYRVARLYHDKQYVSLNSKR
jgi:hypothetical protein